MFHANAGAVVLARQILEIAPAQAGTRHAQMAYDKPPARSASFQTTRLDKAAWPDLQLAPSANLDEKLAAAAVRLDQASYYQNLHKDFA
jgi:hypothetical protein